MRMTFGFALFMLITMVTLTILDNRYFRYFLVPNITMIIIMIVSIIHYIGINEKTDGIVLRPDYLVVPAKWTLKNNPNLLSIPLEKIDRIDLGEIGPNSHYARIYLKSGKYIEFDNEFISNISVFQQALPNIEIEGVMKKARPTP